jgi:hypothetical protein
MVRAWNQVICSPVISSSSYVIANSLILMVIKSLSGR